MLIVSEKMRDEKEIAATRFDRVTSGLWAPRATSAPCCCE